MAFNPATIQLLNAAAKAQLGIPGMFAISKAGNVYLTSNYIASVGYRSKMNLLGMMVEVSQKATADTVGYVALLADSLKIEQQGKGSGHLLQAHKQLASEMKKAMLQSYGTQVEGRKQVASYARNNRLSGTLRRALRAPDMIRPTETGIDYIDQDRLNLEARHWQRLNFGVKGAPGARRGAAQTKEPQTFPVKIAGKTMGRVGFRAKPRPPMYLPAGFWRFIDGRTNFDEISTKVLNTPRSQRRDLDADADRSDRLERRAAQRRARFGLTASDDGPVTPRRRGPSYGRLRMGTQTYMGRTPGRKRNQSRIDELGGFFGQSIRREAGVTSENREARKRTRRGRLSVRYSQQGFYPTSRSARYPTRGIQGTHFLDAGFKAYVNNIDKVYLQYAAAVQNDAGKTAESRALKKTILKFRPGYNFNDYWPINRERIIPAGRN